MKRIAKAWKAAVVVAGAVGALGFGGAQALAAPRDGGEARTCITWACPECGSFGGQWVPKDGKCWCCG